jgi:hypothetical protein
MWSVFSLLEGAGWVKRCLGIAIGKAEETERKAAVGSMRRRLQQIKWPKKNLDEKATWKRIIKEFQTWKSDRELQRSK